jgi:hypothetical protein
LFVSVSVFSSPVSVFRIVFFFFFRFIDISDIFIFFGVAKELPRDSWQITVTYGFDPTIERKQQHITAQCNPQTDRINRGMPKDSR